MSAAGLPVELAVRGVPRPLPPGADLAAYRVVQEGLTNVLRHAGAAAASVAVDWGESLEITVSDDGHGGGTGGALSLDAGCSGCGSGSRSTAGNWRRGRGRTAAGGSGPSCRADLAGPYRERPDERGSTASSARRRATPGGR